MLDILTENIFLVPLFPLYALLIILFVNTKKNITTAISLLANGLGILFSIALCFHFIQNGIGSYTELPFLNAGEHNLTFGILSDKLSALMLFIVTTIGFAVQIYSYWYMQEKKGYNRFFIYLNFFLFAMISMVLSTNLLQMYIFWELVGVASFLLIGYYYQKPSAKKAALKAFLINRIGDFGFLVSTVALMGCSFYYYKFNSISLLSFEVFNEMADSLELLLSPVGFFLISLGFIVAICAKSAQIPLHTWLCDAMEAPTPVSALIHAATMVAAGVYLLARIYPFLAHSKEAMMLLAVLASITSILTAIMAIFQCDIKKMLALSTSSQLGLMISAISLGGWKSGLFHLFTHSYFKALLFLVAGVIIHKFLNNQNMNYMGNLRKNNLFLAIVYIIGVLSISGIFLSGFFSKEAILDYMFNTNKYLFVVILLTSILTIIYMFKSYFLIFEQDTKSKILEKREDIFCYLPIVLLAIPSIFLGFLTYNYFVKSNSSLVVNILSVLMLCVGILFSFFLYIGKPKFSVPDFIKIPFENKLYIDKIYDILFCKTYFYFSKFIALFDRFIVDGIFNFAALFIQIISKILLLFQNGKVRSYLALGVFAFSIIIFVFIFCFSIYVLGEI